MNKCTKPTHSDDLFASTRYVQREHGGGVNAWFYAYQNAAEASREWVGCGLEFAVQLRGEWRHETGDRGPVTIGPRGIHPVSMGERYRIAYRSPTAQSLQVGFVVCGEAFEELSGSDQLHFEPGAGIEDAEMVDLAQAYADATLRDVPLQVDVASLVRGYVRRHCVRVASSPFLRAKRELERHFDCDLPMTHVAEIASMHPDTFARQFQTAYGTSPARYRIALRINQASRLCWSRPDLNVVQIAEECGFRSMSYFHRTFANVFGVTPARARARFLGQGVGRSLAQSQCGM